MKHDEYIPLCKNLYQRLKKSDPEYYSINQDILKALEIAENKANEIVAAWDADPENEALEAAFDEAYAAVVEKQAQRN